MATTLAQSLRADRVSELALRPACTVSPSTPIRDTLACMAEQRTGCALILDDGGTDGGGTDGNGGNGAAGRGRLVGIFTERDFLNRVVSPRLDPARPVRDVMTPGPTSIPPSASVQGAIELMETRGYRHLPVIEDGGRPVGVLSVKDVMHYLVEYFPANVYNLPPSPDEKQTAREGA